MKTDWYKNGVELLLLNEKIRTTVPFQMESVAFLYPAKVFSLADEVWWVEKIDNLKVSVLNTRGQKQMENAVFFRPFFNQDTVSVLTEEQLNILRTKLSIRQETAILLPVEGNGLHAFLLLAYATQPDLGTGFSDFLSVLRIRISALFENWQKERQLEKIRVRFKGILESISQNIVFIAENEHYCWLNGHARRLLGINEKNPSLLAVRQAMAALRSRASNALEIEDEMLSVFQGGGRENWHWYFPDPAMVLKVHCRRVRSGDFRGILWVFDDVSRIAAYEEQLEQQNKALEENYRALERVTERYVLAGKATNDAIWDWDLISDTISWSNSFLEDFGYEKETRGTFWESKIHPQDQERTIASIYKIIRSSHLTNWEEEYRFFNLKKGTYAYIKDRGFVIRDAEGRAVRMVGSMQDITALKMIEKEVVRHNERLMDIANMNSHLVRKPVANMLGLIQLLKASDPKELGLLISMLEDCGEELDQIVKEINCKSKFSG
ncbi:PAS domain-containing protein [Desertivirga xinjiangensis]|uniref:PAS domain-containing protein n=1 Tax=Desertivirga xinjiangensis TaxID=539206 RepID=UPI00210CB37A|nr:PAS domain-containing protein [Pedobacter xinjiangensis]